MTKEKMIQFALKSDDTVENTMWNICQQSRAEAIDEYNAKIKECCSIVGSCDFDDLDRIGTELKEKKNE